MRRRLFISVLFTVVLSLAACTGQETTPPSPIALSAATEAPVMTEPLSATDMPVVTQAAAPTQAGTSAGDANSPDSEYDYSYGNNSSGSGGDVPVTGQAAIKSQDGLLGPMLVDANGRTLYLFLKDTQNANTSTCSALCADNWPALKAGAAGEGLDASLLGSFQRGDGSTQVTYNGWPLYYFAGDQKPGDINGQGISGNWYVVSPSGEAIK